MRNSEVLGYAVVNIRSGLAILLMLGWSVIQAQEIAEIEGDMVVSGNLVIGQDNTQDSIVGMLRWDSITMSFQGYNGSQWVTFTTPPPAPMGTDTLEIGGFYGGGIVFFTAGSHGLIVTDFDLGLPGNLIVTDIQWGPSTTTTGAVSLTDGLGNTALIIAALGTTFNNGDYAAKICDSLSHAGFEDWYLPSYEEFRTMSMNVGIYADAPLTNLANLTPDYYWTSTESNQNQARAYLTDGNTFQSQGKQSLNYVRAVRAY